MTAFRIPYHEDPIPGKNAMLGHLAPTHVLTDPEGHQLWGGPRAGSPVEMVLPPGHVTGQTSCPRHLSVCGVLGNHVGPVAQHSIMMLLASPNKHGRGTQGSEPSVALANK